MAKHTPGLRKKGNIWQVEKVIAGQLVRVSTGESGLEQAEKFLAHLIEERRKILIYGDRVDKTFNQAAAKYVEESTKKSLDRDIVSLKAVMPYIGDLKLQQIHAGVLAEFISDRKEAKIRAGTITRDLAVVRRVLTLAARLWRDENGRPWLDSIPLLQDVAGEKRKPRPISWGEQEKLLPALPKYLRDMVLFGLNTGLRVQEICGLKWSDEYKLSDTQLSVFVVTEIRAKNKHEWIIPLNTIARGLVQERRGNGSEYVFDYNGRKLARMTNRAWNKAIKATGLIGVRVHDLRHTFGKRLRAAQVSLEDRQDLLCHYAGHITTQYSQVEILHLIECVELLCQKNKPELTLIRKSI